MKKVFSFTQSLMNGMVTICTKVALLATREQVDQTMADVKAAPARYGYYKRISACIQESSARRTTTWARFLTVKSRED